jgi:hypothetical protein
MERLMSKKQDDCAGNCMFVDEKCLVCGRDQPPIVGQAPVPDVDWSGGAHDGSYGTLPPSPPRQEFEYPMQAGAPGGPKRKRLIDTTSEERKTFPMARGLLDYFPDALAAVAQLSFIGSQKHNIGEEMHHARGKSTDHADCVLRHLVNRGGFDGEYRESTCLAWRALALLQEELEREFNLPLPRGARAP